jgi:hypothetical protein
MQSFDVLIFDQVHSDRGGKLDQIVLFIVLFDILFDHVPPREPVFQR